MESAAVEALQSELEHYDYMMAKFGVQDTSLLRQRSSIVSVDGGVATVSMIGPMMTRIGPIPRQFGIVAVDMEETTATLLALDADDSIEEVRLAIDSPGGSVRGLEQLALTVRGMSTRTVTVVSGAMSSAALRVGVEADTVIATASTDMIGSVGTMSTIMDKSKRAESEGVKVLAIRSAPLKGGPVDGEAVSAEFIEDRQRLVDANFKIFIDAVQESRGLTEEQVAAVSTGQVFLADEAISLGLIDAITTVGSVPTQSKEGFTMDVKLQASLFKNNAAFADEIAASIEAGHSEDYIVAELATLNLKADNEALTARAEKAESDLALVQEKADSVEAKDAEIIELQAKVDEFAKFEEQNEDPGVGAQGGAGSEVEDEKIDIASMSPVEKAKHFKTIRDAKAEGADK